MKSLFTLLLIASGFVANSTPARSGKPAAVKAFETTYGKNNSAAWSCTAGGCQVQFEHKGQYITALYTHAGQLRWYKKHISSTQLPVALQMGLQARLANSWISDVVEQSGRGGAAYTLTLENASKRTVLKAVGGRWQAVQSEIK